MDSRSGGDPHSTDVLLVNPDAGGGRAGRILPRLRAFAEQQRWPLEICVANRADDLAAKARELADAACPRIFVLGGDGTFQIVFNAVGQHPELVLGIIPAGGGNDLAASLGLLADPVAAMALLRNGEVYCMDAVRVRTADQSERLYTGGGGVGLDVEAVHHASSTFRLVPGRLRYLLSAVRALPGFKPLHVKITTLGTEPGSITARVLIAAVLNTPSYGGGLRLAPDASTDDGLLDIVLLDDLSAIEILTLLPSLSASGGLRTTKLTRFRAKCLRIEADRPSAFHGDGEILGSAPVDISVAPKAIRILRPIRSPQR